MVCRLLELMWKLYPDGVAADELLRRTHENVLWALLKERRYEPGYAIATKMHALGWRLSHAAISVRSPAACM